jgi:hypothetical protein
MSLLEELKEQLKEAQSSLELEEQFVKARESHVADWRDRIGSLKIAIAALDTPTPARGQTGEDLGLPAHDPNISGGHASIGQPSCPSREETKAFVRDVLENTFGQQTTEQQIDEVAREIDALIPASAPIPEAGGGRVAREDETVSAIDRVIDRTVELAEMVGLKLQHDSYCAVHNEPAFPNGPCNCGAEPITDRLQKIRESREGDEGKTEIECASQVSNEQSQPYGPEHEELDLSDHDIIRIGEKV